jgi:hypothetical protein
MNFVFSRSSRSLSLLYLWTFVGRKNLTHLPFSSFIKHLCPSVWLISHFKTYMEGKIGVLLATLCEYDCQMFRNTCSSSALTFGSMCGIHSGYYSQLILLKISPHCGSIILDLVLCSVSPKIRGWTKAFLVDVLVTGSTLGAYSNYLMVRKEEPSPVLASFSLSSLGKHLVVGFLSSILPTGRS